MPYLIPELRSIVLSYFHGFNLFKINNKFVNDNTWLTKVNIEYNFPLISNTNYRNFYIECMAKHFIIDNSSIPFNKFCYKQLSNNNFKNDIIKAFVDLAIHFNDIDLAYDLINYFYFKQRSDILTIFSIYQLGFKLISAKRITMFNKLLQLFKNLKCDFLTGALKAATTKTNVTLIKEFVAAGADTTHLLTFAVEANDLDFFIYIKQTYNLDTVIEQLAKAIIIKNINLVKYLLTNSIYTIVTPKHLDCWYDQTKHKRLFSEIDIENYLATFLTVSAKEGKVDVVGFLLNFDVDFTKTLDYAIICDNVIVINTILIAIVEQLSISDFYYNKLDLIKKQLTIVMKNTTVAKMKDKLQQFISYLN